MEEEANQLYRLPQMTGQARDEEEEGGREWGVTTQPDTHNVPVVSSLV